MARLLVQLKLRLVLNALRASSGARIAFTLSTVFAALVAGGVFYLLAILGGGIAAADLTTVIFCAFALAWLILPLVVFGLDGTLDPATLALYPLRTRPLAVGLLAASATGAWPAATLIGLLGVTIGLARGALGVLIALLAVLLQVLFCITLARFVTTGLAGMLRSRRGKDFAVLLVIPIFAVYEGFIQIVPKLASEGALTAASFGGVDRWLRWTPPGLAVHAIWDASNGHPGTALLRLALLAGIIVVLGLLWIRSLSRALVTTDTSTQSAVRGSALPFARYGLRGTVAARFWLYQRREPFALMYWGITAVIMVVVGIRAVLTPDWFGGLLASGVAGGAFVGAFHSNAIGMSGPGFGLEAMALNSGARCAPTSSGRTSRSARSRCRCSRRSVSAWRPWPSIRWTGSWPWRLAWPGSARAWPWPISSPSCRLTRWKSEVAPPYPGRSADTTARRPGRRSSPCSAWGWRSRRCSSPWYSPARIRRRSGCQCSCWAAPRTASPWPGPACGAPPASPSRSCRNSARSLSRATCRTTSAYGPPGMTGAAGRTRR